jgi:hypothetical protein
MAPTETRPIEGSTAAVERSPTFNNLFATGKR